MAFHSPSVAIIYVGHGTVLIELAGVRILTDPILRSSFGPIRRVRPLPPPGQLGRVDAVVVSHAHADHLDPASLRSVPCKGPVIVPRRAGAFTTHAGVAGVTELPCGQELLLGDATIRAVPARHHGKRFPRGPVADAVGYVLSGQGRTVYFAGDTALFEGMASLAPRVDVALLPVWGWGPHLRGGHLTPETAAEAVRLIRPAYAIPIHWGTYWPIGLRWYRRSRLTAPAVEFKHHVEVGGTETTVVILEPGSSWSLHGDD